MKLSLGCKIEKKTAYLEITLAGTLAGIMGGMLAMPGPIAAAWMSINGLKKKRNSSNGANFFYICVRGKCSSVYNPNWVIFKNSSPIFNTTPTNAFRYPCWYIVVENTE